MTSNNNRFVRTLGGSLLPAGRTTGKAPRPVTNFSDESKENEFGSDVTVSTQAAVPVLPSDLPLESPTIDDDDDDLMPKLSKNKKKKLPPPPPKKAPPPLLKRSSSAISTTTTASNESDVKDNDKNTVYLDDQEEDDVCDFFDHSRKLLQKRRKKKNPKSGSEKIEPAIENNSDSRPKDIGNVDLKEAAKILLSGSESDVDDDDLTFRHYEQPSWSASNANGPVLVDSDSDSNSDVETSETQTKEIPVNVVERRKSLTPPPPEIYSTAPLLMLYNPSLSKDRISNLDLDLDPTFSLHAPSSQSNIELLPELQYIANHAVSNTPSQNKRKRADGSTAGYDHDQMTGQPVGANQRSELSDEDKRKLILKLTVVTMPGQELSGDDLQRWHHVYRTIVFNYSYNAPFTALFENYKQRFSVSEPIFTFNSLRIYSFATPESIGMANPKSIDWYIKAKESGHEELKRPGSQLLVGETTILAFLTSQSYERYQSELTRRKNLELEKLNPSIPDFDPTVVSNTDEEIGLEEGLGLNEEETEDIDNDDTNFEEFIKLQLKDKDGKVYKLKAKKSSPVSVLVTEYINRSSISLPPGKKIVIKNPDNDVMIETDEIGDCDVEDEDMLMVVIA